MGTGAAMALQLLFGLLDRAQSIKDVLGTAQAAGRDVTDAEIQALVDADDVARAALVKAIADRKWLV